MELVADAGLGVESEFSLLLGLLVGSCNDCSVDLVGFVGADVHSVASPGVDVAAGWVKMYSAGVVRSLVAGCDGSDRAPSPVELRCVPSCAVTESSFSVLVGRLRCSVFSHFPWRDGRQLEHSLFAFLQEQFLQRPLALRRQHTWGIL